MKEITNTEKSFILSAETCDEISGLVMDFCGESGTERTDALRYRLSAEECILYWLDHGLEGNNISLRIGRHMFTPYIEIRAEGRPLNPYTKDVADFGYYADNILVGLKLAPEYFYENDANGIRFRIRKKPLGQIAVLCIVMIAAFVVGISGKMLLPTALRDSLLQSVISPIYDTFFDILGCIAGPMIFLSVAWGVYGIGDAATFGKIGKKMMLRYTGTTLLVCACSTVAFPLLGPGISGSGSIEGQFASVAELILSIIPSTIIEPFSTGNTLQIIFMAIVIGIALLYLGKRTRAVAKAIEEVNLLVQFLMEIISKLVPYVIFLVIVNMVWSDSIGVLTSSWKLIIVLGVLFIAVTALFLILTSLFRKTNLWGLFKKSIPTFIVALTTASSAASFSSNITTCEEKFGIEPSLIRFGIPLGMVMHRPISAVYYVMLVFFFAERYGISCSVSWIVAAVIISTIIAIATPPIPGGGAVAYAIIFAQMGIPDEAMAVALALDIITDFLITAFEMFVLPLSLINISYSLGMINRDTLNS